MYTFYIRNTPPDTEVHAGHQVSMDRSTDQCKRLYRATQNLVGQRN